MDVRYREVKTIGEFIDAIRLRVDVFIKEQGFAPGWEPDEEDKTSKHFIAIADGKVVATARCRPMTKSRFKIERMVTKKGYRNKGTGKGLLDFILRDIMKQKPKRIWLMSQLKSKGFYEKCGFRATGKPFNMWGVEHVDMEYAGSRQN